MSEKTPQGQTHAEKHAHTCCGHTPHTPEKLLKRAEKYCADNGERLTTPRVEVLRIVARSPKALGAYDILEAAVIDGKKAKPPTIYRAIEFWLQHGFIHRIESLNAYVSCDHDHASAGVHFLVCEDCKTVKELHTTSPLKDMALEGFEPKHSQTETIGLCKICARKSAVD